MSRELDVQVAKVLGQPTPPTLKDPMYEWDLFDNGTWLGTHWFESRGYENMEWPRHYSTSWEAMGELVQLARCGFGGHVAAIVDMHIYDHVPPNDCFCRIYGPDLVGSHGYGECMPEVVAEVFVKAYGVKNEQV